MASKEQIEDDAYQTWGEWVRRNEIQTLGLTVRDIEKMKKAFVFGYIEGRKDGKA